MTRKLLDLPFPLSAHIHGHPVANPSSSTESSILPPTSFSFPSTIPTRRLTLHLIDTSSAAHSSFILKCFNDPVVVAQMGDFGIRTSAQLSALNAATKLLPEHTPLGRETAGPCCYIVRLQGRDLAEGVADGEGEPIGIISLASRDPAIPPDTGWCFLPAHHGTGYATETGRAFLSYFLDEFQGGFRNASPSIGIIAWPRESNVASVRVAVKLGMVEMGEVSDEDGGGHVIYGTPGADGGKRFTKDTVVGFYGMGEAGRRVKAMLEGVDGKEER